jgi:hypothetical protein
MILNFTYFTQNIMQRNAQKAEASIKLNLVNNTVSTVYRNLLKSYKLLRGMDSQYTAVH